MAEKERNTSTNTSERMVESQAAQKSGTTWAERFIALAKANPEGYELQGWISDAENLFKEDPDELWAFYATLQAGILPKPHEHTLDQDQVKQIRRALLVGLASYGEIERLDNEQKILSKICGKELPDGIRVIHPTGCADTVCDFAEALSSLETRSGA